MGMNWAKSSYSQKGADNCVECRSDRREGVSIRDSRYPERGHLAFPRAEWQGFLDSVKRGEL